MTNNGDTRNVLDYYKGVPTEDIKSELDATRAGSEREHFHVAIENWDHDFNIGSVVRTANAFGVAGVHIVGRRRWNSRGAMKTEAYLNLYKHDSVADLERWFESNDPEVQLFAIDILEGKSQPIEEFAFPRAACLLFGSEANGLTSGALEIAEVILHISQYGSTRSINAGAAAAVAMYAWRQQKE